MGTLEGGSWGHRLTALLCYCLLLTAGAVGVVEQEQGEHGQVAQHAVRSTCVPGLCGNPERLLRGSDSIHTRVSSRTQSTRPWR